MSRIGNKPVTILEGVQVEFKDGVFKAKGPLGELTVNVPSEITIEIKDNAVIVKRSTDKRRVKMLHGTIRSLIDNAVVGVKQGFTKELTLVGLGYRVSLEGNKLALMVGYNHPIYVIIPSDLKVEVPSQTEIKIFGIDKQKVGAFASKVRLIKPPEPYKGKGIRYKDEIVRKKVVKTSVA